MEATEGDGWNTAEYKHFPIQNPSATKTESLKCVLMWCSLAQSWILSKSRQVCITPPEGTDSFATSSHTHTMVLISDEHMSDWRMLSRQWLR